MKKLVAIMALTSALCITYTAAQQKPEFKIFISVDMEGLSGIVHGDQTPGPWGSPPTTTSRTSASSGP